MREIKFRGRRIDSGKWTHGFLVIEPNGTAWISRHFHRGEWEQVDPKTVGQFTGFHDKNGGEIFEGDIVQVVDIGESGVSKVFSEDGMWCINYWESNASLHEFITETRVYVIGNIYENRELLTN